MLRRTTEPIPAADLTAPSLARTPPDVTALGLNQATLHVLLAAGARTGRARGVRTHAFGLEEVPAGLALEVAPEVYTAGPELCFVQMARQVSLVGAVVLGHELCGAYSHFSKLVSGYYERPALTSVAQISQACTQLSGLYGLSAARRALAWVRDRSRSPMETVVSCVLYLPASEHGLAFATPELNHEVALDDAAAKITGTRTCLVDAAWPQRRRGVEYDSEEFHRDPTRDRRRREALQHMGWDIYTIDLDQMREPAELLRTAALLESEVPHQPGSPASPDEVLFLHGRLLTATRCSRGLEPALFGVGVPHGSIRLHVRE